MEKALREAWSDPVVRDRYLVTPLQRRSITGKRVAPQESGGEASGRQVKKRKAGKQVKAEPEVRQSSSGQTKGKGKGKPSGCATSVPDGRQICFAFNNRDGCTHNPCRFLHVCGVCFKPGVPMNKCKHDVLQ